MAAGYPRAALISIAQIELANLPRRVKNIDTVKIRRKATSTP
jgi:hypothetical protein